MFQVQFFALCSIYLPPIALLIKIYTFYQQILQSLLVSAIFNVVISFIYILYNQYMPQLRSLQTKSNESLIYSLLGWNRCSSQIESYQNCKKTGTIYMKDPTECYNQARQLQVCYNTKAMKVAPLCVPIFNDLKECLFQGDTHLLACKQQINELTLCQDNPTEYVEFLRASTPHQRLPKVYNFHKFNAKFDYN